MENKLKKNGRYTIDNNQLTLEFTTTELGEFIDFVYLKDSNKIIKFNKISSSRWKLEHTTDTPFLRCYIKPTYEDKMFLITDFTIDYDVEQPPDENGNNNIPSISVGYLLLLMGVIFLAYKRKK